VQYTLAGVFRQSLTVRTYCRAKHRVLSNPSVVPKERNTNGRTGSFPFAFSAFFCGYRSIRSGGGWGDGCGVEEVFTTKGTKERPERRIRGGLNLRALRAFAVINERDGDATSPFHIPEGADLLLPLKV
jgi:hypothetical protein